MTQDSHPTPEHDEGGAASGWDINPDRLVSLKAVFKICNEAAAEWKDGTQVYPTAAVAAIAARISSLLFTPSATVPTLDLTPEMIVAGANVEPPCSAGEVIERWRAMV